MIPKLPPHHSSKSSRGRFGILLFSLLLTAASACTHTSYESGPVSKNRGSNSYTKGPVYVDLEGRGRFSALGRSFTDPNKLVPYLRAAKATPTQGGGRAVVIRCLSKDSFHDAEALRTALVQKGIPNISIQGPRTATATLGDDRFL